MNLSHQKDKICDWAKTVYFHRINNFQRQINKKLQNLSKLCSCHIELKKKNERIRFFFNLSCFFNENIMTQMNDYNSFYF